MSAEKSALLEETKSLLDYLIRQHLWYERGTHRLRSHNTAICKSHEYPYIKALVEKQGGLEVEYVRGGTCIIMYVQQGNLILEHRRQLHEVAEFEFSVLHALKESRSSAQARFPAKALEKIGEAYEACLQAMALIVCNNLLAASQVAQS